MTGGLLLVSVVYLQHRHPPLLLLLLFLLLLLQATAILAEMARPPGPTKEAPTSPAAPAVLQALISAGSGGVLERVLTAYKAVPDPKDASQLLYDQSMCERVHAALQVRSECHFLPYAFQAG